MPSEESHFPEEVANDQNGVEDLKQACNSPRPGLGDILWPGLGIVASFANFFMDLNLAYQQYTSFEIYYYTYTITTVVIPRFINFLVSVEMYIEQGNSSVKICRYLTMFLFAPVLRQYDALTYAWKARVAFQNGDEKEQCRCYQLMVRENADKSLLHVLQCFLEAAPQLVLELSILFKGGPAYDATVYHHTISISVASVSIAWALCEYSINSRKYQEDGVEDISCTEKALTFLMYLCITVSRITMLSAMVAMYWKWTLVAVLVHWTTYYYLLVCCVETRPSSDSLPDRLHIHEKISKAFSFVFAVVFIFSCINVGKGGRSFLHTFFYVVSFAQNIVCTAVWSVWSDESFREKWHFYPVAVACVVPFILGCIISVLLKQFYPSTGRVSTTRKKIWNSVCLCKSQ